MAENFKVVLTPLVGQGASQNVCREVEELLEKELPELYKLVKITIEKKG